MRACACVSRSIFSHVTQQRSAAPHLRWASSIFHPTQALRNTDNDNSHSTTLVVTESEPDLTDRTTLSSTSDSTASLRSETESNNTSVPTPSQALKALTNPSAPHNSLRTFLAHARRSGLSRTSTVYRGTYYEYLTLLTLRRYGFDLVRVGGRGDSGVDLVGFWYLPTLSLRTTDSQAGSESGSSSCTNASVGIGYNGTSAIKVIVQCKRLTGKGKMGPVLIRELEGAWRGAPHGWRGSDTVGVLVGPRPATAGVLSAMGKLGRGAVWICLEEEEEGDDQGAIGEEGEGAEVLSGGQGGRTGRVRQFLWNQRAREMGLEGVDVVRKYSGEGDGGGGGEVVLMHKGKIIDGEHEIEKGRADGEVGER